MAIGSAEQAKKIDGFSDLRSKTRFQANDIEINIAQHSGYCWGVQRAYDQTLAASKEEGQQVATYGPLIHNPQTIEELQKDHDVRVIHDVAEFQKGKVIVRTHGVPLEVQAALKERGAEVIDATCPYVRVSQNYAALLHREKYHVVIVGNPTHPEVVSILSYAGGEGSVVSRPEDVQSIPQHKRRIGVVVQSTMILEKVNMVLAKIMEIAQEVRVFNTICYVTDERQKDAELVARENDFVIVIGGKQSSNTKKLAVVAEGFGTRTQLIEGPEELCFEEFQSAQKIGILAGASTPNWLIDKVVQALEEHYN